MVSEGLGSCFVRTLYLLLDTKFENIDNEKVAIFISSFGQLLSRLLRSSITTEDLVAKDDLKLLFVTAATAESQAWRRVSADSLMAIARHTMSLNVAQYIQSRECIHQWVNRLKSNTVPPLEAVERLVCLFCFLQDSSSCTQQLLDAFKYAEGYVFLAELLLSLESDLVGQSEGDAR